MHDNQKTLLRNAERISSQLQRLRAVPITFELPGTIFELSQTSGLSSTIRRLKDDNRIPYLQPGGKGGKLLFPPDAIERTSPASDAGDTSSGRISGKRPN
jgi:hypothetical protein